MDRMAHRAEYFRIFREQASQLSSLANALDWYRIDVGHAGGVTAGQAAAWASAGYLPGEAKPMIALGITADLAASLEDIDRGEDSPEQYAMRVLDQLAERGLTIPKPGDQS